MRMLPEFFPIRYPFPQFPHAIDAIHAAMAGFTATIVGSIDLDACRDIRRGIHGGVRHMGILMMGI